MLWVKTNPPPTTFYILIENFSINQGGGFLKDT